MNRIGTVLLDGCPPGAGSAEWHLQRPNERDRDSFFVMISSFVGPRQTGRRKASTLLKARMLLNWFLNNQYRKR
jgi:hypothetical protein